VADFRTKHACTILLSAKKIKIFYCLYIKHLSILPAKKIPVFRTKRAVLCKGWRAGRRDKNVAHRTSNAEFQTNSEKTCEDCAHSRVLGGLGAVVLICSRKKAARRQWQAVAADDSCDNFKRAREILPPEHAAALAEGAKLIPLTQGKFAIVDAADYEWLSQYKWFVKKRKNTSYAESKKKGKTVKMHRLITGAPPHLFVDHIDHNGLNNRRSNLRLCTQQQNVYNQDVVPIVVGGLLATPFIHSLCHL
jgi:hypothetical protein